jgi:hypothetical protein
LIRGAAGTDNGKTVCDAADGLEQRVGYFAYDGDAFCCVVYGVQEPGSRGVSVRLEKWGLVGEGSAIRGLEGNKGGMK